MSIAPKKKRSDDLLDELARCSQPTLRRLLAQLPEEELVAWKLQLNKIDWDQLQSMFREFRAIRNGGQPSPISISPCRSILRLPRTEFDQTNWQIAREVGLEALRRGEVACLMVAGGQGTRLGFNHPKGMYPIGPVTRKPLFQLFGEQLRELSLREKFSTPCIIMTSDSTHEETENFYRANGFFGLAEKNVWFVRQGNLPVVDAVTGEVLFCETQKLAWSPDGHGGMLEALANSQALERLKDRGITTLFSHQVDNPATALLAPEFVGWHLLFESQVTTKVVAKRDAGERMGVVAMKSGRPAIVEYSESSAGFSEQTTPDGLVYWAGNTAIHLFDCRFLQDVIADHETLPLHTAHKVVPCLDQFGEPVTPEEPNALKFERFIFDLIPLATRALFVETERGSEFAPVKNLEGQDSPETCMAALCERNRTWLRQAGVKVEEGVDVEIHANMALEAKDLTGIFPEGMRIDCPCEILRDPEFKPIVRNTREGERPCP